MLIATVAAFLVTCVVYFQSRFLLAAVAALVFAALQGVFVFRTFALVTAIVLVTLLLVAPMLLVVVHAVDAKRGIFLLPTVYAFAVAFLGAALLLLISVAGALL